MELERTGSDPETILQSWLRHARPFTSPALTQRMPRTASPPVAVRMGALRLRRFINEGRLEHPYWQRLGKIALPKPVTMVGPNPATVAAGARTVSVVVHASHPGGARTVAAADVSAALWRELTDEREAPTQETA